MFDLTYYLNGKLNVAVHTLVGVCAVSSFAMLIYAQTTSCTLPSLADSDISIGLVDEKFGDKDLSVNTPRVLLPTISCSETMTTLGLAVRCDQ